MGGNWSSRRGLKRPHDDEQPEATTSTGDGSSIMSDSDSHLHTPKRKRVQSTSKYIVKTLFEEGVNSDVTIEALGQKWPLHKLYLKQCKYFDSMFSGRWTESDQPTIKMEIPDGSIDNEALKIAFRSLYTDNIFIKPVQASSVVAAATLLQMEPLIDHCKNVMKDSISSKTVCMFYAVSELYGLSDIKFNCLTWLYHNLMIPCNASMLSDVPEELLGCLLDSRQLWPLQVEVDVYTLLTKWMFTQLNPAWVGTGEKLHEDSIHFFRGKAKNHNCCFLETEEGRRFVPLFENVRWVYVINDMSSVQLLMDDKIIPLGWLDPFFKTCWLHHLQAEEGTDIGPFDLSEDEFFKSAMRCGRILVQEQEYHWRWLGYQYGLDLLFTLRNRIMTVKRNSGLHQNFEGSLSQQRKRQIMLCVRVTQIKKKNDLWNTNDVKNTGILTIPFGICSSNDSEHEVMILAPTVKFPLQITMHLLCIRPPPDFPAPRLAVAPPPVTLVQASTPSLSTTGANFAEQTGFGFKSGQDNILGQSKQGDGEP